jgi:hypothetical protein
MHVVLLSRINPKGKKARWWLELCVDLVGW